MSQGKYKNANVWGGLLVPFNQFSLAQLDEKNAFKKRIEIAVRAYDHLL